MSFKFSFFQFLKPLEIDASSLYDHEPFGLGCGLCSFVLGVALRLVYSAAARGLACVMYYITRRFAPRFFIPMWYHIKYIFYRNFSFPYSFN